MEDNSRFECYIPMFNSDSNLKNMRGGKLCYL